MTIILRKTLSSIKACRRRIAVMTSTIESDSLKEAALKYLWMHNLDWTQMAEQGSPPIIVGAKGTKVTDSEGKTWIDVNGGYNSVNVGYGRTEIVEAAYEQMLKITYFSNGTTTIPTIKLAKKLAEITPGSLSRVFPVSGGSEATETALKIARAYHKRRGEPGRHKIISRKGSYHGTTGGVLWLGSMTAQPRADWEPIYPGTLHAPQPLPYRCELDGRSPSECAIKCAQAVEDLILFNQPETVAAVIAEPVSNPMGAVVPGDEYWPMLRNICDKYGVLLIDDEVISGFGRTGKMFAIEHWDIVPDIMVVAKGIVSSYLPLAATIVKKEIAEYFGGEDNYLRHSLTFAGHPVAAAASLKNIELMENEKLVENAATVGKYLKDQLEGLKIDHPIVGDVRGLGLMVAVELVEDKVTKKPFDVTSNIPGRLNEKFRSHGLILRMSTNVIQIGPPLCITQSEIDEIIHGVDLSLWELEGELGYNQMA